MVNYNNSAIYKLFCKNEEINDMYIGSTINFKRRKSQHKSKSIKEMPNDNSKCKLYKCIQENGGFDNWDMEILENVNCENQNELYKIERSYIEKLNANLNYVIPSRTHEEYREKNKKLILAKKKVFYYENKDIILKKKKEKYNENPDFFKEKSLANYYKNKESYDALKEGTFGKNNKIYYEKNKEKIIQDKKLYQFNNKEKIKEQKRAYYQKRKRKS